MGRPQDGRKVSSLQFSESTPGEKSVRGARISVDPAKIRPVILPQQEPEKGQKKSPVFRLSFFCRPWIPPYTKGAAPKWERIGLRRNIIARTFDYVNAPL